MSQYTLLIGLLAWTCAVGFAADAPNGGYEEAIQSAMAQHGVSSTILRRISALKDAPPPGSNGFPIELAGKPGIRVMLDRDYWALAAAGKGNDSVTYILNPKDEQSALVMAVGEIKGTMSDAEIAKAPGFKGITKRPGIVANEKIFWRSWEDAEHLYSDCAILLAASGIQDGKKYSVHLHITANTPERRKALEDHLESLQLAFHLDAAEQKTAEPNGATGGGSPHRSP